MSDDRPKGDERPAPETRRRGASALGAGLAIGLALGLLLGVLVRGPVRQVTGIAPPAPDGSPVLARVDDRVLSVEQFRLRWEELLSSEARRFHRQRGGPAHYLDEVVEELLLAEEARDRDLPERADVQEAVRRDVNHAITRPLLAEEVREKAIPESEIRARFEATSDELSAPTRVRVRILAATAEPGPEGAEDDATSPDEARRKIEALRERVLAGEDFAELARRFSEAPSARYGGEIGWIVAGRFVEEYEEAALGLQPGDVSEVVETDDGAVVLLAEEREEGRPASFEEHRERILAELLEEDPGAMSRRYRIFVDALKREHDVTVHPDRLPDDLGPAPPAR